MVKYNTSYITYDRSPHPKLNKVRKSSMKPTTRSIMGGKLPLTDNKLTGQESFPGPDVTYSPPPPVISNHIVNLGCLNSSTIQDIVQVNVNWPIGQQPVNFQTGSNQPNTDNVPGRVPNSDSFRNVVVGDALLDIGSNAPFQYTIGLSSDISLYNISAVGAGYSSITLSQEGILWTLWPLVTPRSIYSDSSPSTYFDQFILGTSTVSKYPIGQMGYFINNQLQGCTPFGAINPNDILSHGDGILSGIQGLNKSLLTTTEQQVGIVVIKVSEQIARIYNPSSGIASDNRYIYIGYDGWSVIYTTANPIGTMASQTFVTPQTVSGSVNGDNYQIIFPPNFPQTVYYKNEPRRVPVDNVMGLNGNTLSRS